MKKMMKRLSLVSIVLSLVLGLQLLPQSLLTISDTSVASALETQASWPSHRGNSSNNGIVGIGENSPTDSSQTEIVWAEDFVQTGFAAPGQAIIVNNELVFSAGSTLFAVNPDTGETIRSTTLPASLGLAATSPLYVDGRIFLPLDSSRLVSFPYANWTNQTNVAEIPGSWTYQDEVTGLQVQTALSYSDGQIILPLYNRVRNSTSPLIALDAETGDINWRIEVAGGFYNASAIIENGKYISATDPGNLIVVDTRNGDILGETTIGAEIRTPLVTDGSAYYLSATTTEGSKFIKFTLDANNNANVVFEAPLVAKSTSAAIIYNGRAYVGTQGDTFHVIDANTGESLREITYDFNFQGLTGSPLAFADGETVHVYFNTNDGTGRVLYFEDTATNTENIPAEVLFQSPDEIKQYSRGSLLASSDGKIFLAMDNGYYVAIGAAPEPEPLPEGTFIDENGVSLITRVTPVVGKVNTWKVEFTIESEDVNVAGTVTPKVSAISVLTSVGNNFTLIEDSISVNQDDFTHSSNWGLSFWDIAEVENVVDGVRTVSLSYQVEANTTNEGEHTINDITSLQYTDQNGDKRAPSFVAAKASPLLYTTDIQVLNLEDEDLSADFENLATSVSNAGSYSEVITNNSGEQNSLRDSGEYQFGIEDNSEIGFENYEVKYLVNGSEVETGLFEVATGQSGTINLEIVVQELEEIVPTTEATTEPEVTTEVTETTTEPEITTETTTVTEPTIEETTTEPELTTETELTTAETTTEPELTTETEATTVTEVSTEETKSTTTVTQTTSTVESTTSAKAAVDTTSESNNSTTSTSSESIVATGESETGLLIAILAMSFATILLVTRIYVKRKTKEN